MADEKSEKTVEVELLADGIRLDGRDYVRGDVVTLPESHAKWLEELGSVGAKGSVERSRKAAQERDEAEARRQRYLQGLPDPEEPAKTEADSSAQRPVRR